MKVADDYHSLVLDTSSLCHIYLLLSRSCNDLFCFPTMPGMDDVIFLFYHVGWMSQFWYIPTWLGDGCMYESLVIGRSFMIYRVMFLLVEHLLQTLPIVRGSMDNTMYIKGRNLLGLPFALDIKGGQYFGVACYL